jgi:hypothetical protein
MWNVSQENAHYLLGFVLDVFFAVGSAGAYAMAIDTKDRFLACLIAISVTISCVGAATCLGAFLS